MRITSVEGNKKNKDRLKIFVDGQYAFSVSEEDYLRLGLYVEKEISQEDIDYIHHEIYYREAKSTGVRFLSLKLRSAKEVYVKLLSEGFDSKLVESIIEELQGMGYINDKIFAQKYLYDRSKLKPKSKKLLKMELLNKGISEEIINEIINDWEVDEFTVAESLARKKFGKYDLEDEKTVRKVYLFLHHRGFSFGLIEQVVNNLKVSKN